METGRTNYGHDSAGYRATNIYPTGGTSFYRRISWGAIIAGALVALVTMLLLNLLGIGIGLGSINPMEEAAPFSGLGTGAIIWWVVSNLIAIFAGAYVAGKMAGVPKSSTSTIHGILSWCLYTLASFYILTTAVGSIISGVGSVVSNTLSAAGSGIEAVAGGNGQQNQDQSSFISFSGIKSEVKQVVSNTENSGIVPDSVERNIENSAQKVRQTVDEVSDQDLEAIAQDVFFENGRLAENITRQDIVKAVERNTNLSRQEVNNVADVMMEKYTEAKQEVQQLAQEAKQEAKEKGQKVAESTSKAAIWSFVALAIGAVVAGAGGRTGKPHTTPVIETESRL